MLRSVQAVGVLYYLGRNALVLSEENLLVNVSKLIYDALCATCLVQFLFQHRIFLLQKLSLGVR